MPNIHIIQCAGLTLHPTVYTKFPSTQSCFAFHSLQITALPPRMTVLAILLVHGNTSKIAYSNLLYSALQPNEDDL